MPIKVDVYNQKTEKVGSLDLSEKVFGLKANESLIHQAMVAQMGNERQVLAHTKQRADVRGGGKKPWRQKGTGRARAGSSRSPIWIGGGVTFGPLKERNFKKDINRKMKQKALFMVLSDKLAEKRLATLEELDLKEYKTKAFNAIINNFEEKVFVKIEKREYKSKSKAKKAKGNTLLIGVQNDDKIKRSCGNLAGLKVINVNNINILDLLKYKNLIVTKDAIASIGVDPSTGSGQGKKEKKDDKKTEKKADKKEKEIKNVKKKSASAKATGVTK